MHALKLVGVALVSAALGGFAIAGERESVPEKVRAAAAKLFSGEDVKFERRSVYDVKGRDAAGRDLALLITEDGAPFRALTVATPAPSAGARAFLGIQFSSQTDATVAGTIEGTAARKAGLKASDRIVQIGEKAIGSPAELAAAIGAYQPGQKVKVVIDRDGWKKTIEVTLGARPSNLDDDGDDDDDERGERGGEHHEKGMKKHDERGERHGKGEKDDDDGD